MALRRHRRSRMLTAVLQQNVERVSGLHLSGPTVLRAAHERMRSRGLDSVSAYMQVLDADTAEMADLIELLVVPETWLFRNPEAFAAASEFARQRHAIVGRPIRIFSVPCATGEEPYSLAMALLDAGMTPSQFTIDAVDISAAALTRAKQAVYRQNSFRSDDLAFQSRYFTVTEDGALLHPEVRALVRFSQGNILAMNALTLQQRFDIIFCRNLLIYFDESTQQRAVAILKNLLDDAGFLFAGYAEMPVFIENGFSSAQFSKAFALKKNMAAPESSKTRPTAQVRTARLPAVAPTVHAEKKAVPAVPPLVAPVSPPPIDMAGMLDAACSLADRGALAEAALGLQAYLKLAPDSAEAYAVLGVIHANQNDLQAAQQCLKRALYLDPNHYHAICQLASISEKLGDLSGATTLRARAARAAKRSPVSMAPGARERS